MTTNTVGKGIWPISWRKGRSRGRQVPAHAYDINVRAYEIIRSIEYGAYRTWGKILPAIIEARDALHPAGRRSLLKTMKAAAERQHKLAAEAEQRAQRYEQFIKELDDPKQTSTPTRRKITTCPRHTTR